MGRGTSGRPDGQGDLPTSRWAGGPAEGLTGTGVKVRKCRGATPCVLARQLALRYLCHLLLEHRCESAHALSNCFFGGVAE